MKFPFRVKVHTCIHPETYKYYFPEEQVRQIWECLEKQYGKIRKNESFQTMEVESDAFMFRSTWLDNPITVLRKRTCTPQDVEQFHSSVQFREPPKGRKIRSYSKKMDYRENMRKCLYIEFHAQ